MPGTRKLGRTTAHRNAMLRGMVTLLLENGQVETTLTRAKEVRSVAEKMITLGKKNTLASRRAALAYITKEDVVKKLFNELAPLYENRAGGYTQTESKGNENLIYSDEVFGNIVMLLGGKAAESVILGGAEKISLGSDEDINVATRLAMGYVKFQSGIDYSQFGDSGTSELMKEAKKVLDAAYEKAIETVTAFKEKVLLISCELVKNENISGEHFLTLIK